MSERIGGRFCKHGCWPAECLDCAEHPELHPMTESERSQSPDAWWSSVIVRSFEQKAPESYVAWMDLQAATQRAEALEADARRLDALEAAKGEWGDCWCVMRLDDGSPYIRPWRWAMGIFPSYTTLRIAIDAALRNSTEKSDG